MNCRESRRRGRISFEARSKRCLATLIAPAAHPHLQDLGWVHTRALRSLRSQPGHQQSTWRQKPGSRVGRALLPRTHCVTTGPDSRPLSRSGGQTRSGRDSASKRIRSALRQPYIQTLIRRYQNDGPGLTRNPKGWWRRASSWVLRVAYRDRKMFGQPDPVSCDLGHGPFQSAWGWWSMERRIFCEFQAREGGYDVPSHVTRYGRTTQRALLATGLAGWPPETQESHSCSDVEQREQQ